LALRYICPGNNTLKRRQKMKVLSKMAFRKPFVLASIAVASFLVASSLTLAQTIPVVPVPKKLATAKPATAV
jgi:hypothetical protein